MVSNVGLQKLNLQYENNALHWENVDLNKILVDISGKHPATPLYVYSKNQLQDKIQRYKDGIRASGLENRVEILYAVKANANLSLLDLIRQAGCGAVTVSGYELQLALRSGFQPEKILLNGNGKMKWEIQMAIENGCMLNVDSLFDVENIVRVAQSTRRKASVLMRINPGLDLPAMTSHPYLATALRDSKFGIPLAEMPAVVDYIRKNSDAVQLIGLHCHIGSTITDVSIYDHVIKILANLAIEMKEQGHPISVIDLGGGLGIDYLHDEDSSRKTIPTPTELLQTVAGQLPEGVRIFVEPGRSIIGSAGLLITEVLGVKSCGSGEKKYLVVDAAMNDLVRPSLYGAHHCIVPLGLHQDRESVAYNVVGPICESGDFLAKDRNIQCTKAGEYLAVLDAGAYGMAMSSNYNMRGRAAEVLVDGTSWSLIRRREDFDDLIGSMLSVNVPV